jgi:phage FluMu protein gp41
MQVEMLGQISGSLSLSQQKWCIREGLTRLSKAGMNYETLDFSETSEVRRSE